MSKGETIRISDMASVVHEMGGVRVALDYLAGKYVLVPVQEYKDDSESVMTSHTLPASTITDLDFFTDNESLEVCREFKNWLFDKVDQSDSLPKVAKKFLEVVTPAYQVKSVEASSSHVFRTGEIASVLRIFLEAQLHGEEGSLETDGSLNIFFILNKHITGLLTLAVSFSKESKKWKISFIESLNISFPAGTAVFTCV